MRIRTAAPFMRIPMKQSRKGESKERQVDILMYGWGYKAPGNAAAARGCRRQNGQFYLDTNLGNELAPPDLLLF
ncbi:hypothetical protein [Mesorhizobium sp. B4-1-1]|uniref:hypothetical protein n=1 Tax=Mesorhizobium sp. B4-1-1 TaxID=2589890 RepID=UPI0015E46C3D|nr:hypothetical protein [Mesorhizobium sp. B4-1-1]